RLSLQRGEAEDLPPVRAQDEIDEPVAHGAHPVEENNGVLERSHARGPGRGSRRSAAHHGVTMPDLHDVRDRREWSSRPAWRSAALRKYSARTRGASGTPLNPGMLHMSTTYGFPSLSMTSTPYRSMPNARPQRRAMSQSSGVSTKGSPLFSASVRG